MGKFDGVLLVSDLDGTFLTGEKSISRGNREAIQRFAAEGGAFTYITGRTPVGCHLIFEQMTPRFPIGCINGGGIYDPATKSYLWSLKLDPAAEELVRFVFSRFPHVGIKLSGFHHAWFYRMNPRTEELRAIEGVPSLYATYADVADQLGKVVFVTEADELDELANALHSHPLAERFDFIQSSSYYYEILPKGASKGDLLLRMADLIGIDRGRTVAVGDNNNDISMLRNAAYGVAVANATPLAKNAADLVLDHTNDEDAIAELIDRLECQLPF